MILGIGTDIVVVDDLRKRMERTRGFAKRAFDPSEIAYCEDMADPWPHFAARFAAKEAVMKALGTGWSKGVSFTDIVVSNRPGGEPEVVLSGATADRAEQANTRFKLSLSHAGGLAVAFAVMFEIPKDEDR